MVDIFKTKAPLGPNMNHELQDDVFVDILSNRMMDLSMPINTFHVARAYIVDVRFNLSDAVSLMYYFKVTLDREAKWEESILRTDLSYLKMQ